MKLTRLILGACALLLLVLPAASIGGEPVGVFCFTESPIIGIHGPHEWTVSVESVGGNNFAVSGHIFHQVGAFDFNLTTISGTVTLDEHIAIASFIHGVPGGMEFHNLRVSLLSTWTGDGSYTSIISDVTNLPIISEPISYTLTQVTCDKVRK